MNYFDMIIKSLQHVSYMYHYRYYTKYDSLGYYAVLGLYETAYMIDPTNR